MVQETYPYKVSISILTYNQVDYIKKAIDSALAQEVDFAYEIVIGDDYSTDGTRQILQEYKQKYPNLITLNLQEEHDEDGIAGRVNNVTNINSARGEYIAFLDGDDFWISKDKLQKQVDFMDQNPGYSICCSDALVIHEETDERFMQSDKIPSMQGSGDFDYKDVVKEDFEVITSSTFFRRKYITPIPDWFGDVYLGDLFLQLMALQYGPGRYFKDLRVGKVWTSKSICKEYLAGRMYIRVKRNDHAIMRKQFSTQEAKPYSYKALFYMASALRYKKQKKYSKMLICMQKVYKHDHTLVAHWLKLAIEQNERSFKRTILNFIYQFLK